MRFHIGPYPFRLHIVDRAGELGEHLIDSAGEPLCGRAIFASREIIIASDLPPESRLDVLLHEIKHCWLFYFPRPRTEEETCNFAAVFSAQAMKDLEQQGGEAALMRLKPTIIPPIAVETTIEETTVSGPRISPREYVERGEAVGVAHGGRADCGVCGSTFSGGQIVNSRPAWSSPTAGLTLTRRLFCPHCGHVQRWIEGADPNGFSNGQIVSGPEYLRGEAIETFLREHPEATGVIVA